MLSVYMKCNYINQTTWYPWPIPQKNNKNGRTLLECSRRHHRGSIIDLSQFSVVFKPCTLEFLAGASDVSNLAWLSMVAHSVYVLRRIVHVCLCVCICLCLWSCLCLCVCVLVFSVCAHFGVCVRMCSCLCFRLCSFVHLCSSVCLFVCSFVPLFVRSSVRLFVCLFACLFVCLFVCLLLACFLFLCVLAS